MSYIDIIYPCVDATDSDAKWQIGRKEAEKERCEKKKKEDRRKRSSKKRKGGKRGERKEGNGGKKGETGEAGERGPWLAFSVECLELPLAHFGTTCTTCRLPFGFDLGLAFHASKIGKHCRYCKHWRVHNIRHLWQVELLQGEWTHSTRGMGTGNLSCRSCRWFLVHVSTEKILTCDESHRSFRVDGTHVSLGPWLETALSHVAVSTCFHFRDGK